MYPALTVRPGRAMAPWAGKGVPFGGGLRASVRVDSGARARIVGALEQGSDMSDRRIGVLFVCLGNICRSPLAEGVFRHVVREAGLEHRFEIDSAGTSAYHVGEPPDRRTAAVAERRGIVLDSRARQFRSEDLTRFDYVLAMDRSNLAAVERAARGTKPIGEVRLLREFDPEAGDDLEVPDPYYGEPQGFELVHDIVDRSCRHLFDHIRAVHGL